MADNCLGGALMHKMRWISLVAWLLICSSSAQSQSKNVDVVIGYSGVGIAHDLLKIMASKRIFEKHGVNATSIYIGSGSLMNQAVVGGSVQVTTSDLVTRMVLRYWGLEPIKDVPLIQVGNTPSRIAAIFSGQVDGGLINPTDVDRIVASGCCFLLADLSALDIPYARFGVAGLGSYVKANPETAQKV